MRNTLITFILIAFVLKPNASTNIKIELKTYFKEVFFLHKAQKK